MAPLRGTWPSVMDDKEQAMAAMAAELVLSRALDGPFSRVDAGEIQLTGDSGVLPAMI